MCTGVVRADDWVRLRAVARRLNGRALADAHLVERTAIRLSSYIAVGALEITFTDDVFGAVGSEWLVIDFKDGLEDVCIPVGVDGSDAHPWPVGGGFAVDQQQSSSSLQ